jgi:DNA-binding protein HU-beta
VNKSELVSRLTARLDGNRTTAVAALNGILEEIQQSLARGERVVLAGFGTFDRRERGPRAGRNPATGETIQIGATVAPVFRAGAGLRQLVTQAAGTATGTARAAATEVASAARAVPAAVATIVAPAPSDGKPAPSGGKPAKASKSSKAPKSSKKAAKADTGKAGKKATAKNEKKK